MFATVYEYALCPVAGTTRCICLLMSNYAILLPQMALPRVLRRRTRVVLVSPSNLLLASLPAEVCSAVLSQCTHVSLPLRIELFNAVEPPRYVHFLTSGMASIVTMMEHGQITEIGLTGSEGLVEKYQLLGPQLGVTRCFMQIPGSAYRMSFRRFQKQFLSSPALLGAVHRYIQQDALMLGQLSACNRLHEVEERMARWLLMVHDRIGSTELQLTQEFLGQMLGARRSSVNQAASSLQRAGYISYSRGRIRLNDPEALKEAACECYPTISRLFHGMYR